MDDAPVANHTLRGRGLEDARGALALSHFDVRLSQLTHSTERAELSLCRTRPVLSCLTVHEDRARPHFLWNLVLARVQLPVCGGNPVREAAAQCPEHNLLVSVLLLASAYQRLLHGIHRIANQLSRTSVAEIGV